MSTSHTDTGKDQEGLSPGSASLYNQDTLEAQQASKARTFSQLPPPARPPRSTRNRWLVSATFTYTATGRVGPAYAFPGVAEVDVTSPNVVKSNQVIVTGLHRIFPPNG